MNSIHNKGSIRTKVYNIDEALKQDNPRNVFLNGQLYVETVCDHIILCYFTVDNPRRQGILSEFLKSKNVSFFDKIELLRTLTLDGANKDTGEFELIRLISNKLVTSLLAIATVRNAFQHNLDHDEAMKSLKESQKFAFLEKKLLDYNNPEELAEDFKKEAMQTYIALCKIVESLAPKA